jgi:hypothetical protein
MGIDTRLLSSSMEISATGFLSVFRSINFN